MHGDPTAGGVNERVRSEISERKRDRAREGLYASTSHRDAERHPRDSGRDRDHGQRHDRERDRDRHRSSRDNRYKDQRSESASRGGYAQRCIQHITPLCSCRTVSPVRNQTTHLAQHAKC
jgi:hypothetical protein